MELGAELPLQAHALDLVGLHAGVGGPEAVGGEHQRRAGDGVGQLLHGLDGQRTALVRLLVEKAQLNGNKIQLHQQLYSLND